MSIRFFTSSATPSAIKLAMVTFSESAVPDTPDAAFNVSWGLLCYLEAKQHLAVVIVMFFEMWL